MIINTQSEKTKCLSRQQGRNCPLDNKDADPDTFCEVYKQGDGYICNAAAKDDPVEDTMLNQQITVNFCDPNIRIDITKEIFKREEWIVSCNWCGAKVREPCYERGIPYENKVHETRKEDYAKLID